jgi:threonine synthase
VTCTHGGESLAGLKKAIQKKLVASDEVAIIDSTAHALKFSGFQDMYYNDSFPDEYEITPDPKLINAPVYVHPQDLETVPSPGHPLDENELDKFVQRVSEEIAKVMDLRKTHEKE